MAAARPPRRLIVNADDFGRSESINEAVLDAHRRGILTSASLMITGAAFESAVRIARDHPKLGAGLHLTLCCGTSVLPKERIPSLVRANRQFRSSAVLAGIKYFVSARARSELTEEVAAQLASFRETGLTLDHLNGHLHFHLHPAVLPVTMPFACRAMRLTRNPLSVDWRLGRGRFLSRLSHALIFSLLSARARPVLQSGKVAHTDQVFGLLEHDRVTESYILGLLPRLPPGDSELYSHPSLDESRHEYEALLSPRVRESLQRENIQLIRYQDLCRSS